MTTTADTTYERNMMVQAEPSAQVIEGVAPLVHVTATT